MDQFDLRQWPGFEQAGGNRRYPAIIDQISIDSRRIYSSLSLFVALKGKYKDGHTYVKQAYQLGAKYALVNLDFKFNEELFGLQLLKVKNPLRAFQDIAKYYRLQLPTKIVAITGSFGKTMVKDLLLALLSKKYKVAASPESFNSQIGVPLSLISLKKEDEIGIIEAAISQSQEMNILADLIRPDFTILTPLGKKHLLTLNNLQTAAEEMMKLIFATSSNGWALLPQDLLFDSLYEKIPCSYHFWNQETKNLPFAKPVSPFTKTPLHYQLTFPNAQSYKGPVLQKYFFNLINMSVKASWLLKLTPPMIQETLQDYQIEPMRTEIWKSPLGVTFINDIYCSDPQSINLALELLDYHCKKGRKFFVFNGIREASSLKKKMDYCYIGKALNQADINHILLIGPQDFSVLIQALDSKIEVTYHITSQEAIQYLSSFVACDDCVLLKGDNKIPFDTLIETFNDGLNNNQCFINLAAIETNILTLRKNLPQNTRLMIIVKALAYGTNDIQMAHALIRYGIDILGVSYVDEAVTLRRAGIQQAIFSINAALYEISKIIKWNLEVGVSHETFILALQQECQKKNTYIKVHLHVNTGMSRFGCRPEEALPLALLINQQSHLILEGLMTHFACAEDSQEDPFTKNQIHLFDEVIAQLKKVNITPPWIHAANSSGSIRFQLPQYNMVRIGLALYGLYSSEAVKQALDLRLALALMSRIVGINECKQHETVSYGRKYTIQKPIQKIAVLPIGYFDGLHRHYSGKGYVLVHGHRAPMVGNICMDYMMIDVTDIPNVNIGDKVLIFGEDEYDHYLSPEDFAKQGDSIIHELITCLGPRIQRIFIHEESGNFR